MPVVGEIVIKDVNTRIIRLSGAHGCVTIGIKRPKDVGCCVQYDSDALNQQLFSEVSLKAEMGLCSQTFDSVLANLSLIIMVMPRVMFLN